MSKEEEKKKRIKKIKKLQASARKEQERGNPGSNPGISGPGSSVSENKNN